MSRYIAFLRAINVGGRTVTMETLRRLFTELGFTAVETFIASGNVIFEAPRSAEAELEHRIETALKVTLGYDVAVFVRTSLVLAEIALYQPFPPEAVQAATALNVAFLKSPIDTTARQRLEALTTVIDTFRINDRELFWLCLRKQSESTFSNAVLEKAIRQQATLRTIRTVQTLAAMYSDVNF